MQRNKRERKCEVQDWVIDVMYMRGKSLTDSSRMQNKQSSKRGRRRQRDNNSVSRQPRPQTRDRKEKAETIISRAMGGFGREN